MECMAIVHAYIVIVKDFCLWAWLTNQGLVVLKYTAQDVKNPICLIDTFPQEVEISIWMEAFLEQISLMRSWSISRQQ